MATAGRALGVDVSAWMIDRARELAQAQGLRNVTFQRPDAQVHRFPPEQFDLAISRFGTMFFDDPAAAFADIRRALHPAARLVIMVWQGHERNEWDVAIRGSLEGSEVPVAVAWSFTSASQASAGTMSDPGAVGAPRGPHRRPEGRLTLPGPG